MASLTSGDIVDFAAHQMLICGLDQMALQARVMRDSRVGAGIIISRKTHVSKFELW